MFLSGAQWEQWCLGKWESAARYNVTLTSSASLSRQDHLSGPISPFQFQLLYDNCGTRESQPPWPYRTHVWCLPLHRKCSHPILPLALVALEPAPSLVVHVGISATPLMVLVASLPDRLLRLADTYVDSVVSREPEEDP